MYSFYMETISYVYLEKKNNQKVKVISDSELLHIIRLILSSKVLFL